MEQSRLAAQQSMDKLQDEIERGRNTVMPRYRSGADDDGEVDDANPLTDDNDNDNAVKSKFKLRSNKSVHEQTAASSRDSMGSVDLLVTKRIDAAVCGVPLRTHRNKVNGIRHSYSSLTKIPAPPVRKGAALRLVEVTEASKAISPTASLAPSWNDDSVFRDLRDVLSIDVELMWSAHSSVSPSNAIAANSSVSTNQVVKPMSGQGHGTDDKDLAEGASCDPAAIGWGEDVLSYKDRLERGVTSLVYDQSERFGGFGDYGFAGGVIKGKSADLVRHLKRERNIER